MNWLAKLRSTPEGRAHLDFMVRTGEGRLTPEEKARWLAVEEHFVKIEAAEKALKIDNPRH